MGRLNLGFLFVATLIVMGCTINKNQLKQVLNENPDLIFDVIGSNPQKFAEIAQKASNESRKLAQQKAEEEQKKALEEEIKNPKKPVISEKRAMLGDINAPIQVVEYSDFQCPYCKRGYQTVEELRKKYGKKVLFVFKHLPLDFHPWAMPAAIRFEAIALQSNEKAYRFHDEVFNRQEELSKNGEKFLDAAAKTAGANIAQMKKDMVSEKVKQAIAEDMAEAKSFGITGTPGFIVNGVALKGAYPIASFEQILEKRGVASN